MTTEALPQSFNELDGNIVFLLNPSATAVSSDSATKREQEHVGAEVLSMLTEEYKERVVFVPPNEDPEKRKDNLRKLIQPRSAIVVCGGDGSVVEVVDFLRTDPNLDEDLRSTAILHAPFGNANNTASELTPYKGSNKPRILSIFENGQIINAYGATLRVSSDHPNGNGLEEPIEYTAVSCHSVQVGGEVGTALNDVRGKNLRRYTLGRLAVDGRATVNAIKNTPLIEMIIDGETVRCVGSVGVSSQAYLRVLKTPASMAEQAFFEARLHKGNKPHLAKVILSHLTSGLEWHKVEGSQVMRYELNSQPGQQLMIETDAEPHLLLSHPDKEVQIQIDVSPQAEPFRIFATNPELIS